MPGIHIRKLLSDHYFQLGFVLAATGGIPLAMQFGALTGTSSSSSSSMSSSPVVTASPVSLASPMSPQGTTLPSTESTESIMNTASKVTRSGSGNVTGDWIVDPEGGAGSQGRTIGEVLALAPSGSTLLLRPGIYVENLRLTRDVKLIGQGRGSDAVVLTADSGAVVEQEGGTLSLQHLTLAQPGPRGSAAGGTVFRIAHGKLNLDDLSVVQKTGTAWSALDAKIDAHSILLLGNSQNPGDAGEARESDASFTDTDFSCVDCTLRGFGLQVHGDRGSMVQFRNAKWSGARSLKLTGAANFTAQQGDFTDFALEADCAESCETYFQGSHFHSDRETPIAKLAGRAVLRAQGASFDNSKGLVFSARGQSEVMLRESTVVAHGFPATFRTDEAVIETKVAGRVDHDEESGGLRAPAAVDPAATVDVPAAVAAPMASVPGVSVDAGLSPNVSYIEFTPAKAAARK
jgi:hypothetical protein